MLKKQNITIARRRTSLVMDVDFWDCLQTLLSQETISLNDFCIKADRCRRHSSLTSAMKLVILIYYRSLTSFTVGADGIFATDITDMTQPATCAGCGAGAGYAVAFGVTKICDNRSAC